MTKKKITTLVLDLLFILLFIAGDQYSKAGAIANLKEQEALKLVPDVLHFRFHKRYTANKRMQTFHLPVQFLKFPVFHLFYC